MVARLVHTEEVTGSNPVPPTIKKMSNARPRQHVIETLTRRIVPSLLPPETFVERDQTERDYGVDLTLEVFEDGNPTGSFLMLQLKGTDDDPPDANSTSVTFDMSVKSLLRAERFVVPILLVWCPVNADPARYWYLWLQEYSSVVLDQDMSWRDQTTVRLHIPIGNVVGTDRASWDRHLIHIAKHPRRLAEFGQLARLAHEARWAMNNPESLLKVFEEALTLHSIFGDVNWDWSRTQRGMVEKGILSCQVAISGIDPTNEQLRAMGWFLEDPNKNYSVDERRNMMASGAENCAKLLSTATAVYFDLRIRRANWSAIGQHTF